MRPGLRYLAYLALTLGAAWWVFASSWPADCGYTANCGLGSIGAVLAAGTVVLAGIVGCTAVEAAGRRVRRRRQPVGPLVDALRDLLADVADRLSVADQESVTQLLGERDPHRAVRRLAAVLAAERAPLTPDERAGILELARRLSVRIRVAQALVDCPVRRVTVVAGPVSADPPAPA